METVLETSTSPQERLAQIRDCVRDDLNATDQLIINSLSSQVPLIQTIVSHIIASGGKRLRPLLVILCARALGYQNGTEHHELAAIIEFVHTATLLHDDVVDDSGMRRGEKTANALWGNQASVLVGDFLYSRAFQMLCRRSNVPVMQALSDTTNAIAEGEVLQLMHCNDPELTEQNYFNIIERKTAKLFASAAEIGAIVATDNSELRQAMHDYGLYVGYAFQIIDDLLDYTANQKDLGKNIGDDFAEGKMTLPLIYALQHTDASTAKKIHKAIIKKDKRKFALALSLVENTNAKKYCLNTAKDYLIQAEACVNQLPESPYREALLELLAFVIDREF